MRRIIVSEKRQPDVSEAEAEAVMEAARRGEQVACDAVSMAPHLADAERGQCLTRFVRPGDGRTAWMYEGWPVFGSSWAREFDDEEEARAFYARTLERRGI